MSDSYRLLNKETTKYTYSNKACTTQSRIDYIMISQFLNGCVRRVDIKKPPKIPDHKAVIATFHLNTKRGPGFWKLNTELLNDNDYCQKIQNLIIEKSQKYNFLQDARQIWFLCKIHVKEFSIKHAIEISQKNKQEIQRLEDEISSLENSISEASENEKAHYVNLKSNFEKMHDDIYIQKVKGMEIRSRAKTACQSELNPTYFKSLEQKRQTNNTIKHLKNENGDIQHETQGLLSISHKFYSNLFSTGNIEDNHINEYLNKIPFDKRLDDNDTQLCEKDITEEECLSVIKKMKLDRSPGHDGLPVEFYKKFWICIKTLLLKSYDETYEKGELSLSQRESVISLIFKKGERDNLKNYRPISLSNVDYKILAFVMSNRIHTFFHKIISPEQTAYVKKRFIGENIRLLEDIIEYTSRKNIPGLLLFLDFEKAFDSLEWNFIQNTLKKIGFGEKFLKWINILYTKPIATVKINSFLSEHVNIKRGVRQGCPLSALIFIMCTEMLCLAIKNNNNIEGIKVELNKTKKTFKMTQYADDAGMLLKNGEQILNALDEVLEFGKVSGLKLNINKAEGLWIGSLANSNEEIAGIKWRSDPIKYLGIYIGLDRKACDNLNWYSKLEAFQKLLDVWENKKSYHL